MPEIQKMQIPNYYHILEIGQHATTEQIKQAFRKLAKRYHPDKRPEQPKRAEQMFRRICIAYEILRDPQRKLMYDLALKQAEREHQRQSWYLENLRKTERIQQKYELMFQELLHENLEAGIRMYEQLQREEHQFRIDKFLSYEDSRDCEFLIAEAYHTLGDYRTAIRIYESLILYETRRPCFHHFIDEIKERLKRIYFHCLINPQDIEHIPADLEKVRALNLSKRETAWLYKKLAEFYFNMNRLVQAQKMLKRAFELYPHLAGAKKICEKLGMEYLLFQHRKRS